MKRQIREGELVDDLAVKKDIVHRFPILMPLALEKGYSVYRTLSLERLETQIWLRNEMGPSN